MPGTAKKEIPPALEHLEVQSVSYEFEDGSAALKDITFKLTSKNTLAILGDSGSGKSTLIDLVTGLSSPTSGHIFFHPVTGSVKFTAGTYPLSYITQNCALFGSDLYENVSLSQNLTQGDQKRIDEIVKSLNLGEFIQSNDGKAREIRADSTNISGGERQRISIARARFFDTDIVILDEPTSALDSENEKKVIQYLEEISHEKTVILVTHSRELLEISDFVLYLHEGEMIFFGSVQDFKIWENAI